MKDYISIAPSPLGEDCAQVGADNYPERSRAECRALIHQLHRQLGAEPTGARLKMKSNPHDFGSYMDVICEYVELYPDAIEYAYKCEAECPEFWDEESLKELAAAGFPVTSKNEETNNV
jgi:hypothetical protein